MKNVLLAAMVLGLLGIPAGIHRGIRGLLGCDRPASKPVETIPPAVADTESAIQYAHLFLTGGKGREPNPDGWIEVPGAPSFASYLTLKTDDGKSYVCDGWKHPLRCARQGNGLRYTSYGPNGKDDHGRGDDIVRWYPSR